MLRLPVAVAVLIAALAVPATAGITQRSTLGDYFFKPESLTVRAGTTMVWRWPRAAGDPHDVALLRGPRGVRRFRSEVASSRFSYRRKLEKRGRYVIYCTLHPVQMRQTITVK